MEQGDAYTLPVGQLEEWKADLDRLAAEIARLTAEREGVLQKIHAVRLLWPGAVPETGLAEKPDVTFVSFVQGCLERAEAGVTLLELADAIRNSPLAKRFEKNPNAVYTVVSRLVDRKQAVRDGKLVYSPSAYARVEAGEVSKRTGEVARGEMSVQRLIWSVLKESPKSLTSGQILDGVRENDEAAAKLALRPQTGYTAIARLVKKGKLVKNGKYYSLAPGEAQSRGWTDASLFDDPPSE